MKASTYTPASLLKDLQTLGFKRFSNPRSQWLEVRRQLESEKTCARLGLSPRWPEHVDVLVRLGLPADLLNLLEEGRLGPEVEKAYALLDRINERLDAWEAANPDAAQRLPWFEAREAWKRAGRPRVEWWEALRLTAGAR